MTTKRHQSQGRKLLPDPLRLVAPLAVFHQYLVASSQLVARALDIGLLIHSADARAPRVGAGGLSTFGSAPE